MMVHRRSIAIVAALLAAVTFLLQPLPGFAVQPDEVLKDPALESRARELSAELRCLVCQNQSIDESDAPLARDLRLIVRERLVAGDSNNEVLDFLVARYGEFVLLKPRFGMHTLVLWGVAPALLLLGIIVLIMFRRSRMASQPAQANLSDEEKAALDRIMKD